MKNINVNNVNIPTLIIDMELGAPDKIRQQWALEAYNHNDMSYKTRVDAQMSSYFIWEKTPKYNKLLQRIEQTANTIYKDKYKLDQRLGYKLVEAWTAIYREGDHAAVHKHDGVNISFVYYIDVGENTTPLEFQYSDFVLEPKNDLLVMFGSNVYHAVPKHKGRDRVVMAGNLITYHLEEPTIPYNGDNWGYKP